MLLEQESPNPWSCRVMTSLLGLSGPCWSFYSSLPQWEHVVMIHRRKKLPVLGASLPVWQILKQPEPFHGLLLPGPSQLTLELLNSALPPAK